MFYLNKIGYWNINSGKGCQRCTCDLMGSMEQNCDDVTGQCPCKPGVGGTSCDACLAGFWGFSQRGCTSKFAWSLSIIAVNVWQNFCVSKVSVMKSNSFHKFRMLSLQTTWPCLRSWYWPLHLSASNWRPVVSEVQTWHVGLPSIPRLQTMQL